MTTALVTYLHGLQLGSRNKACLLGCSQLLLHKVKLSSPCLLLLHSLYLLISLYEHTILLFSNSNMAQVRDVLENQMDKAQSEHLEASVAALQKVSALTCSGDIAQQSCLCRHVKLSLQSSHQRQAGCMIGTHHAYLACKMLIS